MNRVYKHAELGDVTLTKKRRAKNYIFRVDRRAIWGTIPSHGSFLHAIILLEDCKDRLLDKLEKTKDRTLPEVNEADFREKATEVLPGRFQELALKHGFKYTSVKITKSRARWGSCSSKGAINLSLYLLLLPEHLIDYMMLHELCHTVHLNHGAGFWQLLNQVTDNKAYELRKEVQALYYYT